MLVTTVRATKSHGGTAVGDLTAPGPDVDAIERGAANLAAHVGIVRQYGLPCVVSINRFPTDGDAELELLEKLARDAGAENVVVIGELFEHVEPRRVFFLAQIVWDRNLL